MRTDLELFEMYKEEKAHIIGDFKERTGLETFPTFKDWKEAYTKDYLRNHVEVSEKDADRMMDAAVDEAEKELEVMMLGQVTGAATAAEVEEAGIKVAELKEKQSERKEAKRAKRAAKRATKAPRAKKAKAAPKAKGTGAKRKVNKAELTRNIFNDMYPKVIAGELARKDVIAAFKEVGMSPAGASTYYQKWKATVK